MTLSSRRKKNDATGGPVGPMGPQETKGWEQRVLGVGPKGAKGRTRRLQAAEPEGNKEGPLSVMD